MAAVVVMRQADNRAGPWLLPGRSDRVRRPLRYRVRQRGRHFRPSRRPQPGRAALAVAVSGPDGSAQVQGNVLYRRHDFGAGGRGLASDQPRLSQGQARRGDAGLRAPRRPGVGGVAGAAQGRRQPLPGGDRIPRRRAVLGRPRRDRASDRGGEGIPQDPAHQGFEGRIERAGSSVREKDRPDACLRCGCSGWSAAPLRNHRLRERRRRR